MSLSLHIVSFNVPYPADYGGVIDVYYKIKALHAAGVEVHLHNFIYGRNRSPELEKICKSVNYYQRKPMWQGLFSNKPMIVDSRRSDQLLANLKADNFPILFEGLHACYYLDATDLSGRMRLVRMHNNEAEYYLSLAGRERKFLRRLYFYEEYKRLKIFENKLKYATKILAIAKHEEAHYKKHFSQTIYLGPFHGNSMVNSKPGRGTFALYHANLAVNENQEAAEFLITQIFNDIDIPLVIAGLEPGAILHKMVSDLPHISLIDSPSEEKMRSLVQDAHVHILPAFQKTGIKLKLLNSLFNGRFCITNSLMVSDSGLEKYCILADTPLAMQQEVKKTFEIQFDENAIAKRKSIESEFSDRAGADAIIRLLQTP